MQPYAEVWAEPMTKVSKRYEISDVALAKVCKRLDIPVPARGYWARTSHGQRPKQQPLPRRSKDVPQQVEVHPILSTQWKKKVKPVSTENDKNLVQEALTNPHRLTVKLQKCLAKRKPNSYGRLGADADDIDVDVAPASVPRLLRIVDAFIKAAETRGFTFGLQDPQRDRGLSILIDGQAVRFSLSEGSRRTTPPPPKGPDRFSYTYRTVEYAPTGKLTFKILEYLGRGVQPTWSDRVRNPLEDRLAEIIHALVQASVELRELAAERARKAELARQRERERHEAEIQHKKFTQDLADWSSAEAIRRFVGKVEKELENQPSKRTDYAERWLAWAKDHATGLDPLSQGMDQFFEHYQQFGWDKMSRKR
jgi:hypothetical protein